MLHMIIATHNPENCGLFSPTIRGKVHSMLGKTGAIEKKHGVTIQHIWANIPAHVTYFLMDGPSAHVINDALIDLGIIEYNTVDVHPVITLDEALLRLAHD